MKCVTIINRDRLPGVAAHHRLRAATTSPQIRPQPKCLPPDEPDKRIIRPRWRRWGRCSRRGHSNSRSDYNRGSHNRYGNEHSKPGCERWKWSGRRGYTSARWGVGRTRLFCIVEPPRTPSSPSWRPSASAASNRCLLYHHRRAWVY